MYKSRRLKKLWGNKSDSLPPQEDHDIALAEDFSSPVTPDPNVSEDTLDQSAAPDANEGQTWPTNLDLLHDPDFDVVIPRTRISTDMSDSLGGSERYLTHPMHVQFSEDVADRNVELSRTSDFPNPSSPMVTKGFSEDVADRNMDHNNVTRPAAAQIPTKEADPTGSVSPFAMVESYDRKFSREGSDLSKDVYRRVGRKPTGYVDHESLEDMDTKVARRKSLVSTGRPLQEEEESDTANAEKFDEMDSKDARRRSLVIAGRPLREHQPDTPNVHSDVEPVITNMRAPPNSRESPSQAPTTPASHSSKDVSEESQHSSAGESRSMETYSDLENAAVESAMPKSPTTWTSVGPSTSSEDSESSINGGPRALLSYAESGDTPDQGVDARLSSAGYGIPTQDSIEDSEERVDGVRGTVHSKAEPEDKKKSLRKSLRTKLAFMGLNDQPKDTSGGDKDSVGGGPYAETEDDGSSLLNEQPSIRKSNRNSDSSSQASEMISPRTPPNGANETTDNYLIRDSESPIDLSSAVDISRTEDTTVGVKHAPAVTHETVLPQVHHIREEQINREYHNHDVYHRILPIHDVEVLPPRHFIQSADGKLVEVPESTISDDRKAFYPLSRPSAEPSAALDESMPPPSSWRRPFTARFWKGTEGDTKESVGEDGIHRTERTWVHPPTLEEGGKLTGQTEPFYFDEPSEKAHDMGGLVETNARMPGGWDGSDERLVGSADVTNHFRIPRKQVGLE